MLPDSGDLAKVLDRPIRLGDGSQSGKLRGLGATEGYRAVAQMSCGYRVSAHALHAPDDVMLSVRRIAGAGSAFGRKPQ